MRTIILCALALTSVDANAAVLFTSDFTTGQEAIDAAGDGDVVIVDNEISCIDIDTRIRIRIDNGDWFEETQVRSESGASQGRHFANR